MVLLHNQEPWYNQSMTNAIYTIQFMEAEQERSVCVGLFA
jgi:hypothetical protein